MPENNKSKDKKRLFRNWNYKYKLVLMNESTFEEKLNLRLSRMNVFIAYVVFSLVTVALTLVLIAITPLKEYIPGYASVDKVEQVYENQVKLDSLEHRNQILEDYVFHFQKYILLEQDLDAFDSVSMSKKPDIDYQNIQDKKSPAEENLREEWERESKYDLVYYSGDNKKEIFHFLFFPPVNGTITNGFNREKKHFGVDIVGENNQAVKSTLDGVVILAEWSRETGHVIAVQHNQNLISVYKHNSSLLKSSGDYVKAGDPIAIIGNSGEFSTGQHLHFELWYNGKAVNPVEFISFN